jgi:hypothetical protein
MRVWLASAIALATLAQVILVSQTAAAQQDPSDAPLGDVARNLRKMTPPAQPVIDNDNFSNVMDQAESRRASGAALKYLMAGDIKGFQVSAPDATCSLSFSANAKALLSTQYAQMDLPPADVLKLEGPATIEGDALTVSVFNHTNWHVSEVSVALTIVKKKLPANPFLADGPTNPATGGQATPIQQFEFSPDEVRPEKKADVTLLYRMRAAAPPSTTTVFSARLNLELAPGEEWHWAIVQARGYPPEGRMEQARSEKIPSTAQETLPQTMQPEEREAPLGPSPVSLAQPQ